MGGIQLSTNQKYIVDTGFATIDSFIQTSVRIRSLDDRTMGKYSCRATNKLGETQGEMTGPILHTQLRHWPLQRVTHRLGGFEPIKVKLLAFGLHHHPTRIFLQQLLPHLKLTVSSAITA